MKSLKISIEEHPDFAKMAELLIQIKGINRSKLSITQTQKATLEKSLRKVKNSLNRRL